MISPWYYLVLRPMAQPTTIELDPELKGRLQHLAERPRRSAHWMMRAAIEQYVEREEGRESFKEEALASWAALQETGRHVTGAQVREWLRTWGSDEAQPAPKCHQ